jgi:predicted amidohydrolase/GNAT superfamily N-acetyltransferase
MNQGAKPRKGTVKVRRWTKEDIPAIVECQNAAYPDYSEGGMYDQRTYEMQFAAFPEGQFLAELDGQVVGYATSLIVQLDEGPHTYEYDELTGSGTFSTHTPGGDTLYGADIAVHPDFRGKGVAGKLYVARKQLMRKYNLRRMVAYGRLTGFPEYAGRLTAQEYVDKVMAGEISDSALSAHIKAGYQVLSVSMNIMHDQSSLDYATLLQCENENYDRHKRRIAASPLRRPASRARVCAGQYFMRQMSSWEEFEASVCFFVDVADEYHSHFLVLPEYFTAALLSVAPAHLGLQDTFLWVADQLPRYRALFTRLAQEYGLYIIAGTMPVKRHDGVYNVAHFFTPSGGVHTQDKLHVTPSERELWGVRPGSGLQVYETPFARVGILVCYDIEFPELSRLLALSGAEVIFVPFSTDERTAYDRVRFCAQARAIENSVYVVLAGNAGNLPRRSYLLNYARSAIITPSDFGFPASATAAEADPNVETVVIAELDFSALSQHRRDGSVRPLSDRRIDLFDLKARIPIEVVHAD